MTNLWQDVRYGFRMLRKHPGFSAIAIVTLAMGIGVNTSIFSIVNALLLRPIQFKDSDRLVLFWNHYPGLEIPQDWLSPGEYTDVKAQSDVFEEMTIANGGSINLNDAGAPERVEGIRASSSFFSLLNIQPVQGRALLPDEDEPGKPPTAVISHRLWQRRFGADPNFVGKTISLNGQPTTVVGVLPASLSLDKEMLPTVAGIERVDVIRPLALDDEDRSNHASDNYTVMARLKPGVSMGEAQVQVDTIVARLQLAYPKSYPATSGFAVGVVPMLEQVVGGARPAVLMLFVAVGFVLLIACANVANLLLARAVGREKEFSIRTALGAGRLRLIRQLLVESMLLTLAATLALGIGANTAIFSVVNAMMLKPLPYSDPTRLVSAGSVNSLNPQGEVDGVSPADFWDWKDQSTSFEQLAALSGGGGFSLKDADQPDVFSGARVSFNFFQTFGVQPLLGRAFSAEDGQLHAPETVVLSHRLWMRRFGGDPAVVGKTFNNADGGTTVIGVMAPDFNFPSYADVWVPLARNSGEMRNRSNRYFSVVGRIRADQSIESAEAELETIASRLEAEHPQANRGWTAHLTPLRDNVMGSVRTALFVLLGAVGCVLLIACTNVANLLLARAASRRREMAIRLALGAGRARIMRQLLTESLVLGIAGGAIGLAFAVWGLDLLIGILPSREAFQLPVEIRIDRMVMLLTLAVSALTGIVFGLVPAWQASRPDVGEWLKEGDRSGSSAGHKRTRSALVVAEIAIALVLLVGAGLLVQSFVRLRHVDLGYDPIGLMTMWVPASPARYPDNETKARFYKRLLERVSQVPGTEDVALSSAPWFGFLNFQFNIADETLPAGDATVRYSSIAPDYFRVLRAQVRSGRDFDDRDDSRAPSVAIINEALARRYFPEGSPIGRRIVIGYLGRRLTPEIVGVSADIKQEELGAPTKPEVYVPYQQVPWLGAALVIRAARGDPMTLKKDLQQAIWEVDKDLPVSEASTVEGHLSDLVAEPRLYTLLLGAFATAALILASIGIYGVMSYSVTERTREIGIRMALGAKRLDVLTFVVRQGLLLAVTGVAIGVVLAFALTRVISSQLYGISATDPLTFTLIPLLLASVTVAACFVPARRATKVDPMIALRCE